jgi:hypothetical protein
MTVVSEIFERGGERSRELGMSHVCSRPLATSSCNNVSRLRKDRKIGIRE